MQVVSREAIYYGATDSSSRASLINWALPYAQRYIFHMYQDKYLQQGGSKFEKLRNLQIIVVEKLFYRNVVKKCEIASKKRIECSCLLQVLRKLDSVSYHLLQLSCLVSNIHETLSHTPIFNCNMLKYIWCYMRSSIKK